MSGFGHRVYKNYDPRAKVSNILFEIMVFVLGFGQESCSLNPLTDLVSPNFQKFGDVLSSTTYENNLVITFKKKSQPITHRSYPYS